MKENNKYYGNLVRNKVSLDIYEVDTLKMMIYWVSWALKLVAVLLLQISISNLRISKGTAYFVSISQKIHMIALNSIALDLIPYCLRTIFHSRYLPLATQVSSHLGIGLLVLDFCEIWYKGGKSEIEEYSFSEAGNNKAAA